MRRGSSGTQRSGGSSDRGLRSRGSMQHSSDSAEPRETTPMTARRQSKPPCRGVRVLGMVGLAATAMVVAVVARRGALTTSGDAPRDQGVTGGKVGSFGIESQKLHQVPRPRLGLVQEDEMKKDDSMEGPTEESTDESEPSPSPKVYTYTVKNKYPHDPNAFTQGLVFQSPDTLLESTGSVGGPSTMRQVDLKTGEVVKKTELDREYFAEGLTALKSTATLAQITWKKNTGFLYDASTLEKVGEFKTPLNDGWGLTTDPNDPNNVIITDASDLLTFAKIEPGTDQEWPLVKQVKITDGDRAIRFTNELETVGGEIWANVIETECIVRIDPETGKVVGWINLQGLKQQCDPNPIRGNVMNGIAFDVENNRLFVTGKKWSSLFEVEISESDESLEETRRKCWPAETLSQYGYP